MASPTAPAPAKTLSATGPIIIIILIVVAAFLGYYQVIYYPSSAKSTTTTQSIILPSKFNVTVTIPDGAASPSTPTNQTFLPDVITVYIGYNATVIWVNKDSTPHTVTASPNAPDSRFNQWGPVAQPWNVINPESTGPTPTSLNFTFTVPGSYNYYCSYHAWMKGEVIVKQAPPGL